VAEPIIFGTIGASINFSALPAGVAARAALIVLTGASAAPSPHRHFLKAAAACCLVALHPCSKKSGPRFPLKPPKIPGFKTA
jgi:hypothetical protein